jgi:hypothetical protein
MLRRFPGKRKSEVCEVMNPASAIMTINKLRFWAPMAALALPNTWRAIAPGVAAPFARAGV